MRGPRAARRKLGACLAAAALVFASGRASADEPTPKRDIEDVELDRLLDVKLEEKLGTTKTVSHRTESVLRAPATVTTLDADRIRLSGATTVPELLRWVPGVQVIRTTPGNWVVSLRGTGGLAGNDLVVLLDGMMLNSPLDGSVPWDSIPVDVADVDRIEVVRGPVSPIYGPNAYTGVINIVTKDAGLAPSAVAVRGQAGADVHGREMGATGGRLLHAADRLKAGLYWTTRYERFGNETSGDGLARPWTRFGGIARVGYQLTKNSAVSVEGAFGRSRRSELDHLALGSSATGRTQAAAIAKYTNTLGGGPLAFEAWGRINTLILDDDPRRRLRGFTYAGTAATRSDAGVDLTLRLGSFSATAGGTVMNEHVHASYLNLAPATHERRGFGVFGSATYSPVSVLDLSVAARADVPPTLGALLGSYRASAVLHGEETAVRLSVGSSYRAPSWVEGAGRFVDPTTGLILLEGTSSIAAPRNDAAEIGLVWGPSVAFQLKPTLYASRLRNVVVENFAPLVRKTFENDPDDRTIVGGELEASFRIRENVLAEAWAGVVTFPGAPSRLAMIGVPDQNSALTGGARVQASVLAERLSGALGAYSASSRSYAVRLGIPPELRSVVVPQSALVEAMTELRPFKKEPVFTSLRVQLPIPHHLIESPLPGATALGTTFVLGLEYRE